MNTHAGRNDIKCHYERIINPLAKLIALVALDHRKLQGSPVAGTPRHGVSTNGLKLRVDRLQKLSVSLSVYYICMYTCTCMYVHMHAYVCVRVCLLRMHLYIYACMRAAYVTL